jgi:gamma-D-glutamyl-L-lysine dipeptidyl-peptidase
MIGRRSTLLKISTPLQTRQNLNHEAGMNREATINVSVSSHYHQPSYASEVATQGILGEQVGIVDEQAGFTRIVQEDGYQSWVSSDQLAYGQPATGRELMVISHGLRIRLEPDHQAETVRDAVIGCRLTRSGEEDGWYRLTLPDGLTGWAEKHHFGDFAPFSAEAITALARAFLGYPYCWGGRTPKGFDCSGLVQTIFRLHGLLLPRDSWQQHQQHYLGDDHRLARPGDLLFFGKTPERVTHVGIALGEERFIHASGWVRRNSLRPDEADFSPHHRQTFISVNRYRPQKETA